MFSHVLNILKRDSQCHFQNNGNAKHVFPYERGGQMIYINQGLEKGVHFREYITQSIEEWDRNIRTLIFIYCIYNSSKISILEYLL